MDAKILVSLAQGDTDYPTTVELKPFRHILIMWPKHLIWSFFFRPSPPADEKIRFSEKVARVVPNIMQQGWSFILITPCSWSSLINHVPERERHIIALAYNSRNIEWVERSDIAILLGVYAHGGLKHDTLDCEVTDWAVLEKCRCCDPLVVPGNNVRAVNGGLLESDVFGCSARHPDVLELILLH